MKIYKFLDMFQPLALVNNWDYMDETMNVGRKWEWILSYYKVVNKIINHAQVNWLIDLLLRYQ